MDSKQLKFIIPVALTALTLPLAHAGPRSLLKTPGVGISRQSYESVSEGLKLRHLKLMERARANSSAAGPLGFNKTDASGYLSKFDEPRGATYMQTRIVQENKGTPEVRTLGVERVAFRITPSALVPAQTHIDYLPRSEGQPGTVWVKRKFLALNGDIDVSQTFYAASIEGKSFRVTHQHKIRNSKTGANYATKLNPDARSLHVELEIPGTTDTVTAELRLPPELKGQILDHAIHSDGNLVTVLTSEGVEADFHILPWRIMNDGQIGNVGFRLAGYEPNLKKLANARAAIKMDPIRENAGTAASRKSLGGESESALPTEADSLTDVGADVDDLFADPGEITGAR